MHCIPMHVVVSYGRRSLRPAGKPRLRGVPRTQRTSRSWSQSRSKASDDQHLPSASQSSVRGPPAAWANGLATMNARARFVRVSTGGSFCTNPFRQARRVHARRASFGEALPAMSLGPRRGFFSLVRPRTGQAQACAIHCPFLYPSTRHANSSRTPFAPKAALLSSSLRLSRL